MFFFLCNKLQKPQGSASASFEWTERRPLRHLCGRLRWDFRETEVERQLSCALDSDPAGFYFFVFCNCTIILKFRHIGEVEDDGNILPIWRGNRQFIFGGASFLVSPNWSDKNVHFITSSSPWSGFWLIFWAQNQQVQGGQTTVDASSLHHWTWRQAGPALFQSLGYLAFEVGGCGAQLPNFPWVFLQLWWIHEQKWESNH